MLAPKGVVFRYFKMEEDLDDGGIERGFFVPPVPGHQVPPQFYPVPDMLALAGAVPVKAAILVDDAERAAKLIETVLRPIGNQDDLEDILHVSTVDFVPDVTFYGNSGDPPYYDNGKVVVMLEAVPIGFDALEQAHIYTYLTGLPTYGSGGMGWRIQANPRRR